MAKPAELVHLYSTVRFGNGKYFFITPPSKRFELVELMDVSHDRDAAYPIDPKTKKLIDFRSGILWMLQLLQHHASFQPMSHEK
jgi:hypothetical protein